MLSGWKEQLGNHRRGEADGHGIQEGTLKALTLPSFISKFARRSMDWHTTSCRPNSCRKNVMCVFVCVCMYARARARTHACSGVLCREESSQ